MKKYKIIFLPFFLINLISFAQDKSDDMLGLLDDKPQRTFTTATFKSTRNTNFHTIEVLGKRCLDFRISHRFGDINSGAYNAFGIDGGANIRCGLEYSHDGRLMFGIGRTSNKKIVDDFIKYKLLRQSTDNKMPITLTLFTSTFYTFEKTKINGINKFQYPAERMTFCNQIMIGRKFNSKFSFQLTGAMIHMNIVEKITDKNDCYIIGAVTRFKFANRQAITLEYGYRINKYSNTKNYDSFGIGYDLETGGHVFQINLTNSFGLTEDQYFMNTNATWKNLGIRLGFNISRVFSLQRKNPDIPHS